MTWFVKAFIKASVAWLTLGVAAGIAMAVNPAWIVHRAVHVHIMLLGFVAMMIFGVAYHVIPRFAGTPLYSERAAGWHWWMANAGVVVMAAGFVSRDVGLPAGTWILAAGGLVAGAGAYTFAFLVWRTIDGPVAVPGEESAASNRLHNLTLVRSGRPNSFPS
jgi:cbb3-type cytochrome oxidase subunit 1